jgi:hypothetical protein
MFYCWRVLRRLVCHHFIPHPYFQRMTSRAARDEDAAPGTTVNSALDGRPAI